VLESAYGYSRDDIGATLHDLLERDDTFIEQRQEAKDALATFHHHDIDFADAVIHAAGQQMASDDVYTFDEECLATGIFKRPE
jgi:predicted nucleic-acid-binding protein